MNNQCFLCGRTAALEKHHIFGGANRKKSDKLGAYVYLCHNCHNEPPNGVHHNAQTMLELHQYGQRMIMQEQKWDTKTFIKEFGKNYL